MATTKYLFEIPRPLASWTEGYAGVWRTQIIDTFLKLAYHWEEHSKKDYPRLFIEIYYQEYIDDLENDFDTPPEDQYYRDQISFYMRLQEEIDLMANDGTVEKILRALSKQWAPYMAGGEFYTEFVDARKYFVYE